MYSNIILIGFPGVGKTSIGKVLAERLQFEFIDIDSEIKESLSLSISDIFRTYGETYFRDLETKLLGEYVHLDNVVISTGGGIVLREENCDHIRKASYSIWLSDTLENIESRLVNDEASKLDRPVLDLSTFESRRKLYQQVATVEVTVAGDITNTVEKCLKLLG